MMKKQLFLIFRISICICFLTIAKAQTDHPSDIQFDPANYMPGELPDLGLSHIKGAETVILYDAPNNRKAYDQPYLGTFSHHSHITIFNGMVVATWSNHYGDEDSPGQYVRYSISVDGGRTWQNPNPEANSGTKKGAVLFPPMEKPLRNPQPRDALGKKISVLLDPLQGYRPHDKCGTGRKGNSRSYENDNCRHYHLEMCANGFAEADGRLFAIAEVAKGINDYGVGRIVREIKTNGKSGNIFWLNNDVPDLNKITPDAINIDAYSNTAYSRDIALKIINYLKNPLHMPQWDFYHKGWVQSDGKYTKEWNAIDGVSELGEPTYAYTFGAGTYARLWRTKTKWLYAHFSYDQGKSWTGIERTSFPDCGSRTNVGNLPDGRSYIVNNVHQAGRNPLVISLSNDGKLFDKAYIIRSGDPGPKNELGRAKVNGYQYPHSAVICDYLLIIYSVNKESVAVTRLPLKEL